MNPLSSPSAIIAVEGPIGAGKTSLTRRLANHINASLLLENAEENPFLPRFYRDPKRYALSTQLFFLFQRSAQISELKQPDLFSQPVVTDFLLDKDPLFARLTLDDDEYHLYQTIYQQLQLQSPRPDLVIYLQAKPAILMERIRKRAIAHEAQISTEYLNRLADSYARYFHQYDVAPLLIVNCEHFNFVDNEQDFMRLVDRISAMKGPREFFNQSE